MVGRVGGLWLLHSLSVAVSVMQLASITCCTLLSTSMPDKWSSQQLAAAAVPVCTRLQDNAQAPPCSNANHQQQSSLRNVMKSNSTRRLAGIWRNDNRQSLNESRYIGWRAHKQKAHT
jgi:hypothetical protein